MADAKDWTCNSNEVTNIRLRHPLSKNLTVNFDPAFTYALFNDEETIFGYKDLHIGLEFAADTLRPSLSVNYADKFESVEVENIGDDGETKTVEADDIEGRLREYLPTLDDKEKEIADGTQFKPPGKIVTQYEIDGRTYGIWSTRLSNPAAKRLLRHMQIFVLFFIEGGTFIELDDPEWTLDRWRIFFVYAIDGDPTAPAYSLVGYCTTYRLFFMTTGEEVFNLDRIEDRQLPISDPALIHSLPSRLRISQFLILPPYQAAGHGSRLYQAIVAHSLADPTVREITVEDPNESFDDLRDINDLIRLRAQHDAFRNLRIDPDTKVPEPPPTDPDDSMAPPPPALAIGADYTLTLQPERPSGPPPSYLLPPEIVAELSRDTRLSARQFSRLLEMQLLASIPTRHRSAARISRKHRASDPWDRAYYFWRLMAKARIYRHNKDQLIQAGLEGGERVQKLEETLDAVEADHTRLMEVVVKREARAALEEPPSPVKEMNGAAAVNGKGKGKMAIRGAKRKVIEDDDDDDDEASDGTSASKRAKVSA